MLDVHDYVPVLQSSGVYGYVMLPLPPTELSFRVLSLSQ